MKAKAVIFAECWGVLYADCVRFDLYLPTRDRGWGGKGVKLCHSSSSSCALRISSFFALWSRWTMWGHRSRQGSVLQLFLSIPVIGQRWRKNCHHCRCHSANQCGGLPHWYVALLGTTLPSQPFCLDIVIMIEFTTRPLQVLNNWGRGKNTIFPVDLELDMA